MPASRYDYDPDYQPEPMDQRRDRKDVAKTSRSANIRQLQQAARRPAMQLEQQLGIGRPAMRQVGERGATQTMGEALGAEPGYINGRPNQPMRQQMAVAQPAKATPMTAEEAAAHFLREARGQMDILNAGRRDGSIDANLDRQMMGQINHLLNLHNEAKASISQAPRPAPKPAAAIRPDGADQFLREARKQMDILNAGRRNGTINASVDRQMMDQINNLLNLHNEARSGINTMPRQAQAPAQPVKGAGMWQQPKAAPKPAAPAKKAPAKAAKQTPLNYRKRDPNHREYDMNRLTLPPEDLGPEYTKRGSSRTPYTRARREASGEMG